jgi:hypothetical protein
MKNWLRIGMTMGCVMGLNGFAQEPIVEEPLPQKDVSAAIFVRNTSRGNAGLNEEVDSLRELISSELAGAVVIYDSQYIADAFRKGKVTTAEERNRLVEGVFTGGSALQVAKMLEADYLITVAINSADRIEFPNHVNYRTTLSVKVLDGQKGGTLTGFRVTKQQPARGMAGAGDTVFRLLFEDAATEIGEKIVANLESWAPEKAGTVAEQEVLTLTVSSTVDQLLNGLEVGARAPNDLLDEVRRVVGGVTVWVDGAVVGSTPGSFEVSPGMHTIRVTRQWMQDWEAVVNVKNDTVLNVGLELSPEGIRKWGSMEKMKAHLALDYAQALMTRGIKVNVDTQNWRDVGNTLGQPVSVLIQEAGE